LFSVYHSTNQAIVTKLHSECSATIFVFCASRLARASLVAKLRDRPCARGLKNSPFGATLLPSVLQVTLLPSVLQATLLPSVLQATLLPSVLQVNQRAQLKAFRESMLLLCTWRRRVDAGRGAVLVQQRVLLEAWGL
jgi:hypothetical protein